MENTVTHLGLDVHKDSIAVAVLRPGELEPDERIIANTPDAIRKLVARADRASLAVCYEAGPNGYAIQRLLASLDVACDVIAPSLIPRRSGNRVKTDRLDARNLARLHRAGELTAIRVPTAAEEALRDLVRLREDLKDDRRRTQLRIKSFLLRHGRRCPDHRRGWSRRYLMWVRSQRFEDPNTQLAFDHLLAALNTRAVQLDSIDQQLAEAAERPPLADAVARLRTLRGIETLSALTIASEVCDFRRFASATSFMGFTGLVPSEHSSGMRERRGSITKTGNSHLRRVLVEAAWTYRHKPYVRPAMAARSAGQPPEVLAYSWQAQVRLHGRFKAVAARKNRNVAVVAVARELAGFIWGLMNERTEV
ncbi:MAG: IS110 family transposase, partial [Vicinamibacterales bacterium]